MSLGGRLPLGWSTATLGDVCKPPQYGWTTRAQAASTGLKLLRTTDISQGAVDWSQVPVCAEEPSDPLKYLLSPGDIVISRAGSVGLSALLGEGPRAVFASYLIRFRPQAEVNPRYLASFLQSSGYWSQISASAAGIALQNVNAKKLSAVSLPVAPYPEQVRARSMESELDDPAEIARQLANLSPRAAKAVAAAAKAQTPEEREAALAAIEAEDETVNRGLLLKFLGSVDS